MPFFDKHGDHRVMPLFVLINQVDDHICSFSVDGLFAGMMEMKLRQLIRLVANRDGISIAGNIVLTNVVTGINNLEWNRTVVNLDRREIHIWRVIDINRGLLFSSLASRELGAEISPMLWSSGDRKS